MLVLSFMVILLMIVPLPELAVWANPNWLMFVLIVQAIHRPTPSRMGAFCLGLSYDIVAGSILGQHALTAVFCSAFLHHYARFLRAPLRLQQGLCVLCAAGLYQLIVLWVQAALFRMPVTWAYWLTAGTTALAWMIFGKRLLRCFGKASMEGPLYAMR